MLEPEQLMKLNSPELRLSDKLVYHSHTVQPCFHQALHFYYQKLWMVIKELLCVVSLLLRYLAQCSQSKGWS